MEALHAYLATLAPNDRVAFALRCGTTLGYLRKLISTGGEPRERLCSRIEAESGGAVTRRQLRPHDWAEVWPELAQPITAVHAAQGAVHD